MINSTTPKYSSSELKKRIREYSVKVKKNKRPIFAVEPTGSINKTTRGF